MLSLEIPFGNGHDVFLFNSFLTNLAGKREKWEPWTDLNGKLVDKIMKNLKYENVSSGIVKIS